MRDFHYDGMFYRTRRKSSEIARQINYYIKEWGASGFRSAFMLHNLDWLHDLQVQYAACTYYMAMGGNHPNRNEYHAPLYERFHQWVRQTYAGKCWHVLPKIVAAYYRQYASFKPRQASREMHKRGELRERVKQDILLLKVGEG